MRKTATRVTLRISLILACCAGSSIAVAQQSLVCPDAQACLQPAPLLASAPGTVRNSSDYGLVRRDANPIEQDKRLASQGYDQPVAGFSSGDGSWLRWPSLTDF